MSSSPLASRLDLPAVLASSAGPYLPAETPSRPERRCLAAPFFRRTFLSLLQPMTLGHLVIDMPDGCRREFGQSSPFARPRLPLGIARSARIVVRRESFFRRCVLAGDIGFAEAYIDGDWESPDVTAVVAWFVLNRQNAPTLSGSARKGRAVLNLARFANRLGQLVRPNSRRTAARNIREHYDLSNAFFEQFLDPSMMYSAGKYARPDLTLEEAQFAKNEALCRLLRLKPSHRVLEIGTGWGGWAIHAARRYNCRVTTVTLSVQQAEAARARIRQAGLSERVEVLLMDYREITGVYDRIVSIEMVEALGHRYLPEFSRVVSRALKPEGLLAMQFITCPDHRYAELRRGVDFIQKHIFPGSLLLSLNRMNEQLSRAGGFVLNSVDDLGPDYALTLRAWYRRFLANEDRIARLGFDDRFRRKWAYYLMYCEAAFALRHISVVHTLHTRANNLSLTQPVQS